MLYQWYAFELFVKKGHIFHKHQVHQYLHPPTKKNKINHKYRKTHLQDQPRSTLSKIKPQKNINMIFDTLLKNGLIVRKASNSQGLCLILKPPIIVDKKILNKAYKIIDKTLKSL